MVGFKTTVDQKIAIRGLCHQEEEQLPKLARFPVGVTDPYLLFSILWFCESSDSSESHITLRQLLTGPLWQTRDLLALYRQPLPLCGTPSEFLLCSKGSESCCA